MPNVLLASQVRLWNPKTGKPIGDALRGHTKWITSLAWEPCHMCVSAVGSALARLALKFTPHFYRLIQKPNKPAASLLVKRQYGTSVEHYHSHV